MPNLPERFADVPVGREQLSREELSRHQREAILIAATGVFAKRGFQATTIDNIVAGAKISVGTYYSLFDGKEDCFFGVYDRIVRRGRAQIAAVVATQESWGAEAYAGLRELLAMFVAEPLSARIVLIEVQTSGQPGTLRYNSLLDAATSWLRGGRRHSRPASGLPASFELAAISGVSHLLQQQLLAGESRSLEALFADSCAMILEPILGAGEMKRLSVELAASPAR
jgi:AcrR family transcriptional regulator